MLSDEQEKERKKGILNQLRIQTIIISKPAGFQANIYDGAPHTNLEIANGFFDYCNPVIQQDFKINKGQLEKLTELADLIARFPDDEMDDIWDISSLSTRNEWQVLRDVAGEVIAAFDWSDDISEKDYKIKFINVDEKKM